MSTKINFSHNGDQSVGMYGDEASINVNLPIMSEEEIYCFAHDLASYLSESIWDSFFVDFEVLLPDAKKLYGNTKHHYYNDAVKLEALICYGYTDN